MAARDEENGSKKLEAYFLGYSGDFLRSMTKMRPQIDFLSSRNFYRPGLI